MTTVQFADVRTYWEPGVPEQPKRGLFEVAEVIDVPDPHLMLGIEYMTNRCTAGSVWLDMCRSTGSKTFKGLTLVKGAGFTVYDALECEIGESQEQLGTRIAESLQVKAEAVAEAQLQKLLTAAAATASTSLADSVGVLEKFLADGYAGLGLLHMDRYTAVRAGSQSLIDFGTGATITGTPVVMGRGYTRGASKFFAAASGRVVVLRSRPITSTAPIHATGPGRVLVEQQMVIAVECVSAWTEASAA